MRLLTLGKVPPLLPECKLAKDGLPNRMVKIPSLSVFRRCCLSVAEPFAELGGFATSHGRNSNKDFASFSKSEGCPCSYSSGC